MNLWMKKTLNKRNHLLHILGQLMIVIWWIWDFPSPHYYSCLQQLQEQLHWPVKLQKSTGKTENAVQALVRANTKKQLSAHDIGLLSLSRDCDWFRSVHRRGESSGWQQDEARRAKSTCWDELRRAIDVLESESEFEPEGLWGTLPYEFKAGSEFVRTPLNSCAGSSVNTQNPPYYSRTLPSNSNPDLNSYVTLSGNPSLPNSVPYI